MSDVSELCDPITDSGYQKAEVSPEDKECLAWCLLYFPAYIPVLLSVSPLLSSGMSNTPS